MKIGKIAFLNKCKKPKKKIFFGTLCTYCAGSIGVQFCICHLTNTIYFIAIATVGIGLPVLIGDDFTIFELSNTQPGKNQRINKFEI